MSMVIGRSLRWPPTLVPVALGLAIFFRLAGMVVNGDANDNHMDVIEVMAYEHRIPADNELWESFQP